VEPRNGQKGLGKNLGFPTFQMKIICRENPRKLFKNWNWGKPRLKIPRKGLGLADTKGRIFRRGKVRKNPQERALKIHLIPKVEFCAKSL